VSQVCLAIDVLLKHGMPRFFIPSVLAGPNFSYSAYARMINNTDFKVNVSDHAPRWLPQKKYRKAAERFSVALFFMMFHTQYGASFDFYRLLRPEIQSESFVWK